MQIKLIPSISLFILSLSRNLKVVYLNLEKVNLSEVNYLLLYKLIYARLLKIYAKPIRHVAQNHRIITFDSLRWWIKMKSASSNDAAWCSFKLEFHRSINQMNHIELLCKIKVLLPNYQKRWVLFYSSNRLSTQWGMEMQEKEEN